MNKVIPVTTSLLGFGYGYQKLTCWTEKQFPPEKLPTLTPRPGYKVYGYMGCPQSKIEAVQKLNRNLFFAKDPVLPQHYALSRTRLIDRLSCNDKPVVLQIEIPESEDIDSSELWKDSKLNRPTALPTLDFVSFYPAIPPKVQKKCKLQVRVHHVVTCNLQQDGGSFCRSMQYFSRYFD